MKMYIPEKENPILTPILSKIYGEDIPAYFFIGGASSYHAIYVTEDNKILYKVTSKDKGLLESYTIFEAYCSIDPDGLLRVIINTSYTNLWLYMEIGGASNYAYFAPTEFLEEWKTKKVYIDNLGDIAILLKSEASQ